MAVTEQLLARFPQPTAEEATNIAVIGDPHVSTRNEGGQRLPERSQEHFRRAIQDSNQRDTDGVVSVGDLTANGGPWDFDAVDRVLDDLDVSFVSIPGNHDVPATSGGDHEVLPQPEFEDRYANGGVPFVHRIGEVELIGLDSMRLRRTLDDETGGRDQLDWLEDTLARLADPIVLLHHPLPGITDWLKRYEARVEEMDIGRLWSNPDPLVDVLEANDVSLVLSGHKHIPGVAPTRGIWEVMAPTTCTFPQGYLRLDVDSTGTDVWFVPVADHEEMQEAFFRRYNAFAKTRLYASAGAVLLASPPVDTR